jgi:hypothetical protein
MRIFGFALAIALIVALFSGCSSDQKNPITGNDSQDNPYLVSGNGDNGSSMIGAYILSFDPDTNKASVTPDRETLGLFRVTSRLPAPKIHINSWDPIGEILDVDVTIKNSTTFTAYDPRLIIYADDLGHMLLEPDAWTDMFDNAGGMNINPFRAYLRDVPPREFGPDVECTENLRIVMPNGLFNVAFSIYVSYPYNCREPYAFGEFNQTGEIFDVAGWSSPVDITVIDWQSSVDSVNILAPEITGEDQTPLTFKGNYLWEGEITNNQAAVAGEYSVLVKAMSEDPFELSLYNYVTITILESSDVAKWTYFVYMHESNLGQYALANLNEMEGAGSLPFRTDIVVLWDKEGTPDDVILHIEKDPIGFWNTEIISPEIDDHGEVIPPGGLVMGDQQTVEKFLRWGMSNYPAEKYSVEFWDHGDGPFGIVEEDMLVKSCCNGLSIWEIRDACQTILNEHPEVDKFEFIGFDACLMAWMETAYCLRNVTRATVGSEMLEPATGWKYYSILNYLNENYDTCTYEDITAKIVETYLNIPGNGTTLSAVRSETLVNNVIPALNTLSQELMNSLSDNRSAIGACRTNCGSWGAYCDESHAKDAGYLAQLMSEASLPQSVKDAAYNLVMEIDGAMIAHGHTASGEGACPNEETGMQIWFPSSYWSDSNSSKRSDYQKLDFTDTLWDDFLAAYD